MAHSQLGALKIDSLTILWKVYRTDHSRAGLPVGCAICCSHSPQHRGVFDNKSMQLQQVNKCDPARYSGFQVGAHSDGVIGNLMISVETPTQPFCNLDT
jgi:hypothetical protein